ncbi:surfeit locus protein 1-like isoform X2 [Antedon mediterranea]|uniref:surfeit locus protein 1-like isoform X2 n=1 Tax=Antedon mediterranea TaxID=105859 RepID=UPI003AF8E2DB
MELLRCSLRRILMQAKKTHTICRYSSNGRKSEEPSPYGNLLLSIPVITFCLGTWQVKRRKWKLNLIEELHNKTTALPVPLCLDQGKLAELEYCRVSVKGRFEHSKEMLLMPRHLVTNNMENQGGSLFSSQGESGAQVITPFHCTELGKTILVNRGWVPRNRVKPETRVGGQITDEVTIVGIVRSSEKRAPFLPDNDVKNNRWHFRDHQAMAVYSEASPILIDNDLDSSIPGGPIGGQTRVTLRNEHLNYIITWYSLSIATLLLWYYGIFKKRKVLSMKTP